MTKDLDGTDLTKERQMLSVLKVAAVTALRPQDGGSALLSLVWKEIQRTSSTEAKAFGWGSAGEFLEWVFAKEGRRRLRLLYIPSWDRADGGPEGIDQALTDLEGYKVVVNSIDDMPRQVEAECPGCGERGSWRTCHACGYSRRGGRVSLRWAIVAMSSRGDFEVVSWHDSEQEAAEAVGEVVGEWLAIDVARVYRRTTARTREVARGRR